MESQINLEDCLSNDSFYVFIFISMIFARVVVYLVNLKYVENVWLTGDKMRTLCFKGQTLDFVCSGQHFVLWPGLADKKNSKLGCCTFSQCQNLIVCVCEFFFFFFERNIESLTCFSATLVIFHFKIILVSFKFQQE